MADWFLNALQAAWRWIVDVVAGAASALMDGFIAELPVFQGTALEPFADWLGVINQWVPLDIAIACMVSYWAFLAGFIVVKFILKCIPTIG